ncbi:hypothetical protein [Streptomyces sp. NPDC093097]|uniref:hypothetical protein n=1 Tax=Streptomyces sp. NPDC093097 TaxID=3366027 RepID=UPI0037FDFACE
MSRAEAKRIALSIEREIKESPWEKIREIADQVTERSVTGVDGKEYPVRIDAEPEEFEEERGYRFFVSVDSEGFLGGISPVSRHFFLAYPVEGP